MIVRKILKLNCYLLLKILVLNFVKIIIVNNMIKLLRKKFYHGHKFIDTLFSCYRLLIIVTVILM